MTTTITLADIRAHSPCADGWRKLLTTLGTDDMATVVSIGDVAMSNGPADALWCLRCLPSTVENRRLAVAMILPSVKRASARATDRRVHDCIAAVERWQAGDDSVDLDSWAWARAWAAAAAPREAAWAAAAAVAAAAPWAWAAAAREAAWAAAWAAAAREAERASQITDIIAVSPLVALAGRAET